MPTRHNAIIKVKYHPTRKPLNIFLNAYGHPDDVRRLCKLATRARRRQIMLDPEVFYVKLIVQADRLSAVYIMPRGEAMWVYLLNLVPKIPTVTITSKTGETVVNLFDWLGPERRISEKPKPQVHYVNKKRGRPTNVARNKLTDYVPAPDYITPDGRAVFNSQNKLTDK